jgi:hypothetical protein
LGKTELLGRVKKNRSSYESELKKRLKEEKLRESNGMLKFIISNLIWIEWWILHYEQLTESTFMRETFLPLCEILLSVEDSSSLPHDTFSSDAILFHIITESLESTKKYELLCCNKRKKLFGMILSHSSFNSFHYASEQGMAILGRIFEYAEEREKCWVMKEGGTMCVMKKMRDKRERDDYVRNQCFETVKDVLWSWRWRLKKEQHRKEMRTMEREGGIDVAVYFGRNKYCLKEGGILSLLGISNQEQK